MVATADSLAQSRDRVIFGWRVTEDSVIRLVPYLILVLLVVVVGLIEPATLRWTSVQRLLGGVLVLALVSVGQTFALMGRGLDLSVGGVISVVNVIAATQMTSPGRVVVISLLLVAFAWVPGLINGFFVAYLGVTPIIVTLGTWFMWAGVALLILPTPGTPPHESLGRLVLTDVFGVRLSVLLLVATVLIASYLSRTRLALQILGAGSEPTRAFRRGLPVRRALLSSYMICSSFAVLAGLVVSARTLSGDPAVGTSYILLSFVAVVIGGTQLAGGNATTTGSVIGALVLTWLASLTFALRLPGEMSLILSGVLLVSVLSLQLVVRRAFSSTAARS